MTHMIGKLPAVLRSELYRGLALQRSPSPSGRAILPGAVARWRAGEVAPPNITKVKPLGNEARSYDCHLLAVGTFTPAASYS